MKSITIEEKLGREYIEHNVFEQLENYSRFYDSLSFSIMSWHTTGTLGFINLDTYACTSMQGTIESISIILRKGRINDAYALLRKYYDSVLINIYTNLYVSDNFGIDNIIVTKIENWRNGTEKIPNARIISRYIKESDKLKPISESLYKDTRYKIIRDRCNDNTHYNFYYNVLLNDNEIHNPNRIKYLNVFSKDIESIFILHLSYLFYLNDHYMASSDYQDSLEMGYEPENGSEYWVAKFIQEIFDNIIMVKRPDIGNEIKGNTQMML